MNAFYCNICNVSCGNAENCVAHVGGKSHLSKVKNNVSPEQLFCKQCKLQFMNCNNFEQHKKSVAHMHQCRSLGITATPPQRPPVQVIHMDVDLDDFDDDDFVPTIVSKTATTKPAVPAIVTMASVPAIVDHCSFCSCCRHKAYHIFHTPTTLSYCCRHQTHWVVGKCAARAQKHYEIGKSPIP